MKRAWILSLPIFLCACGPTGIGTGIASLFGGDDPGGAPAALAFVDDFGRSTPVNAKVSATPSGSRLVTNPRYEVSVAGVVASFAVVVVTPDDVEVPELLPARLGNSLVWEVPVSNAPSEGWYAIRITGQNAFGPATITRAFFVEVGPPMSDTGVAGGVHVKKVVAIPEGDKTLVTVLWRAGAGDNAIRDADLSRVKAFIVYAIPVRAKAMHRDTVKRWMASTRPLEPGDQKGPVEQVDLSLPQGEPPKQPALQWLLKAQLDDLVDSGLGMPAPDEQLEPLVVPSLVKLQNGQREFQATFAQDSPYGIHVGVIGVTEAGNRTPLSDEFRVTWLFGRNSASKATSLVLSGEAQAQVENVLSGFSPQFAALTESLDLSQDLNGDGVPDGCVLGEDGSLACFLQKTDQNGRPTGEYLPPFVVLPDPALGPVSTMTSYDHDGDGITDFAVGSEQTGRVGIYRGGRDQDGNPTLTLIRKTEIIQLPPDFVPAKIFALDVNADGYADMVVRAAHRPAGQAPSLPDRVFTLLQGGTNGVGDGDPDGNSKVEIDTGVVADQAILGRFDGDEFDDIALVDGSVVRILLGSGSGLSHPAWQRPQNLPTGEFEDKRLVALPARGPRFLAKGDFNADGIDDIVTSNEDGSVSMILGSRSRDFVVFDTFSVSAGGPIAVGDFNRDTIPDVFVGGSLHLLTGRGSNGKWDGSFEAAVDLVPPALAPFSPVSLSLGDFDLDGLLDLLAVDTSGNLMLLSANGFIPSSAGTFAAALRLPTFHGVSEVSVADMNGDALPDLIGAGAHSGAGAFTVFFAEGIDALPTGSFPSSLSFGGGNGPIHSFVTADLDGDGTPDVALGSPEGNEVQFGVILPEVSFVQDAFYRFRPLPFGTPDAVAQTIAGDFNHDGVLDLASLTPDQGSINILMGENTAGRPDGSFLFEYTTVPELYAADATFTSLSCGGLTDFTTLFTRFGTGLRFDIGPVVTPGRMGSGDFDGDGGLDLIVADEGEAQFFILRNFGRDCAIAGTTPATLPDRPGFGMFQPAKRVTIPFPPGAFVVGDFDGDRITDVIAGTSGIGNASQAACFLRGSRTPTGGPGLGDYALTLINSFGAGPGTADVVDIATGDLNGDRILDLVIVQGSGPVDTYLGRGDGTFAHDQTLPAGPAATSAVIADVNLDGIMDIVVGRVDGAYLYRGG